MNISKPMNVLRYYSAPFIERLLIECAPIHTYTYREAIRAAKPYISFVYIDIDCLPTATNIPFIRPDLYTLFTNEAARQPDLRVLYRAGSKQGSGSQMPGIQAIALEKQTRFLEVNIPVAEQLIFLNVTLNPKDLRETPTVQSLSPDAQTNSVEVAIPIVKQHVFWGITLNVKEQQEGPSVQAIMFNRPIGSVEVTIPIGEPRVSLDAALDPEDLREVSIVQSRKLDTQASAAERNISCTTQQPSLNVPCIPFDQPEKRMLISHKRDMQFSSVEKTIAIVEQKASLDVIFNHDKKNAGISILPYFLSSQSENYINVTSRKELLYDSSNHSLVVMKPRCFDYPVAKARTGGRIVRYHRYSRTNLIASGKTVIDFNS